MVTIIITFIIIIVFTIIIIIIIITITVIIITTTIITIIITIIIISLFILTKKNLLAMLKSQNKKLGPLKFCLKFQEFHSGCINKKCEISVDFVFLSIFS